MKIRFSMGHGLLVVMLMTILVATACSPMPVRAEDGYLWAYQAAGVGAALYKLGLDGSVVDTYVPSFVSGPIGGLELQPAPTPTPTPTPVGGILIPVGKAEILAPWIGVALAVVALAVFAVKRSRS